MTSRILDLDIVNPRGWGEWGQTGDACEHGHQLTETDIENLKKHCGLEISYHNINGNKYKLISLLQKDATDTVISILGGDGKYYIIDSTDIPNGLIMPFAEYCKIKKLNLVIVDPDHPLEWAWQVKISPVKIEDKKIWGKPKYSVTPSKFKEWLKLAKEFYIKNHKNLSEDFFLQNKILHDVHVFIKDLEQILEYIKNLHNLMHTKIYGHRLSPILENMTKTSQLAATKYMAIALVQYLEFCKKKITTCCKHVYVWS